jgi:hypothetical protein
MKVLKQWEGNLKMLAMQTEVVDLSRHLISLISPTESAPED